VNRTLTAPPIRRSDATVLSVTTPAPRDVWSTVLDDDEEALPTQDPRWTDALAATGRWTDSSRCYELTTGRRVVLPAVSRRRSLGRWSASMPTAWGFGGIVAEGGVTTADVAAVLADVSMSGSLRWTLRPNPLQAERWTAAARTTDLVAIARRAHVVDLRDGIDAVWRGFGSSARRDIRRSERLGVSVEVDTDGSQLPVFFDLLEASRTRWADRQHEPRWLAQRRGAAQDPPAKWAAISGALGPRLRLYAARHHGELAAAIVVLSGRNVHYTRGAMRRDVANRCEANYALLWHALQDACSAGALWFHMGESGESASLSAFKERFGAVPYDYAELRHERVPISRVDAAARRIVKRAVGFRDA
jgi:hypothetical protein